MAEHDIGSEFNFTQKEIIIYTKWLCNNNMPEISEEVNEDTRTVQAIINRIGNSMNTFEKSFKLMRNMGLLGDMSLPRYLKMV